MEVGECEWVSEEEGPGAAVGGELGRAGVEEEEETAGRQRRCTGGQVAVVAVGKAGDLVRPPSHEDTKRPTNAERERFEASGSSPFTTTSTPSLFFL